MSDIEVFFPNVAYAFTDNISMGFGMSVFPGVDLSDQLFFFTPKIGVKASDNLSLALGSFIMGFPEEFDSDNKNITIGMIFGMATYGTADKSLTFGLGTGFADGEFAEKPLLILGGEYRLLRKLSFVSENWILPGLEGGMVSGGLRFFGKEMAVDFALFTNVGTDGDDSIVIPYLDFVFFFDI